MPEKNTARADTERTNVKAPLTGHGATKSKQNSLPASQEVNKNVFSAQVLQAPYQASNEIHSMSRQKSETLHDNAGAARQCKSGGGLYFESKAPVTLSRILPQNTKWEVAYKNQCFTLSDDKYSLPIHNRTQKKALLWQARENTTFKKWQSQNEAKFGFIPLGDLILPKVNLANNSRDSPLDIHERLRASQVPNFLGSQINVPSQLNIEAWEEVLENYWDKQLLFLIRYGFPLDFDSKFEADLQCNGKNHPSAIQFPNHVETYLKEERQFKAILGPFKDPPISPLHISPFLTREKQGSQNRRVIIDLSFPKGHAVNSNISKDVYLGTPFLLTLPSIDNITNKVRQLGKGSHLYKVDITRAFRHIKIDPRDYHLLGLRHENYFIDTCLPFGYRYGSAIFQRISDAVRHIMTSRRYDVINYVDDVIGFELPSKSNEAFHYLQDLLKKLGFSLNEKKIVKPQTKVSCLGVEVDTVNFTVAVPPDKMEKIKEICYGWVGRKKCRKNELQSLLGALLYISKCVKYARSFLNRMLSVLRDNYNSNSILLPDIFHQDLNWFIKFLPFFNGKTFFDHTPVAGEIQLDACLQGLGACFINQVYTIEIPLGYKDFNISQLEMLNILVALRVWGPAWQGKKLLVHCDNQAVVAILNSGATRDLTLAAIARNIFMESAKCDISLSVIHILGKDNPIADLLSRWYITDKANTKLRDMIPQPRWVNIPSNILEIDWSI